ncbi:MAG: ATP-binding protein [Elusimicrobiota bacterium]
MTDKELEALLDDIESDRAERKESPSDTGKIRQAICAFANDMPNHRQPGVLFIGADDLGNPVGLSVTEQLIQTLSSIRSDGNILPLPVMTVQKRKLKGKDLAVVVVQPSDAPPVKFKGTIWIRVGSSRAIASPDEERRLSEKRRHKDLPFDVRPVESAKMNVLDELAFRQIYLPLAVAEDVLRQNQRTLEDQMLASKFAHTGPPVCPTNLGILSIGKTPTDWIPCAYIQFVRFAGGTLTDPIKTSNEIRGPLPELLRKLDEILKINIQEALDITSADKEIRRPDYPLEALQQLARNAVLHRSYENTNAPIHLYWFEDRVEIQNPGGPFGEVNRINFGKTGVYDYRNLHIATVMKELGYVQRFGIGIELARKACRVNGNPDPDFAVEDTFISVTLRRAS